MNLRGLLSIPITLRSLAVGLALTFVIPHAEWFFRGKPVMTARTVEYGGTQWLLTNMRWDQSDVFSAVKTSRRKNLDAFAGGNIIVDHSEWMPRWVWPPHAISETAVKDALATAAAAGTQADAMTTHFALGWPMRAFSASSAVIMGPDVPRQEFERGMYKRYTGQGPPQIIPYWPMPLGLTVDTALFGGAAFILLHISAALTGRGIAARRSSAGRCARCGYLRAGLFSGAKCPECGAHG